MKAYLVGGAVRDRLLGLPVRERDWVVVGATEQEMLKAGFRKVEADFPVFLHPETGEEYALARTETKTGPGYAGFRVHAGPDVTLEQDLRRRDLTVNAMAEEENGELIDPFGGREDLDQGFLRHVSPAFAEDPLRLLRVARFAARLGRWGFRVAHGTHALMKRMAASEDLLALTPERVWRETGRALAEDQPWRYFAVLHRCGALARLMPELDRALGEPGAHESDEEPGPLAALRRASARSADPRVRFAALMGGVPVGDPRALCRALKAPGDFSELLQDLAHWGGRFREADSVGPEGLLELLEGLRAFQGHGRFERFLLAGAALWPDPGERALQRLDAARRAAAAVSTGALREAGLSGARLGEALGRRRVQAIAAALEQPRAAPH